MNSAKYLDVIPVDSDKVRYVQIESSVGSTTVLPTFSSIVPVLKKSKTCTSL